jgi:hypothetical protein
MMKNQQNTPRTAAAYAAVTTFLNEGGSVSEWNSLPKAIREQLITEAEENAPVMYGYKTAELPQAPISANPSEQQLHALWYYDNINDVQDVAAQQPKMVRTVWDLAYQEGIRAERDRLRAFIPEDLSASPAPLLPEQLRNALTQLAVEEGFREGWWADEAEDYINSRAILAVLSNLLHE